MEFTLPPLNPPKYKLFPGPGAVTARRIRHRQQFMVTKGFGTELLGGIVFYFIAGMVIALFTSPAGGIIGGAIVTILVLALIVYSRHLDAEYTEDVESRTFYVKSAESDWFPLDVSNLLKEALDHPDYKHEAETIIEAGFVGIENAADKAGQARVSLILDESLVKLKDRMQEHKDVNNMTAEDITRNLLEGYK